jgi:NADPH-dependent F420 reductase
VAERDAPASPVALLGGTGRLGPGLALRWARAGIPVVIGSREAARASARASEIAGRLDRAGGDAAVRGMENAEAAAAGRIAVVTVPFEGQAELLALLRGPLAGKIVVSTAVPVRFEEGRGPVAVEVAEGSAALQAAALLPESRVVGALHTVSSAHLGRLDHELDEDVLLSGDDEGAKSEVRRLVEAIPGLRAVDAGGLRSSRLTEQLTVLLLGVNRLARRTVGVRLVGL